jgi:hypothetical protein
MRHQQRHVALERRPARTAGTRHRSAQEFGPRSRDRAPADDLFRAVAFDQADAGRMCAAELERSLDESLQDAVGARFSDAWSRGRVGRRLSSAVVMTDSSVAEKPGDAASSDILEKAMASSLW